jgi:hypothetical protein
LIVESKAQMHSQFVDQPHVLAAHPEFTRGNKDTVGRGLGVAGR